MPAMPLHLLKLCVGCDSVQDLDDWIRQRLKEKKKKGEKPEHIHTTRMLPKRADELIDGGSLYWVIRGEILCRERLLAIRPFTDRDGIGRCRLVMDGKLHLVQRTWPLVAVPSSDLDSRQAFDGLTKQRDREDQPCCAGTC
jgi:hypothetical protein